MLFKIRQLTFAPDINGLSFFLPLSRICYNEKKKTVIKINSILIISNHGASSLFVSLCQYKKCLVDVDVVALITICVVNNFRIFFHEICWSEMKCK